ncbi:biotin-protein ligase [Helicostylum pulchrum]|uniref:BPL/LPL catalytic domain-containing protein n=1 Tax=Helicostylum pulchrum TaxID=562976 RepID=A0ABP9YG06_9FUNG|nr:biotin-protein ligase [Helicostylum pulchrum]
MNVLVYNDLGASPNSVKHTINTLKTILGHVYDIMEIDQKVLQQEPWEVGCAMLVMPGGRDMPYCQALNGEPNTRIQRYVNNGGRYLGLCAGAYYASTEIEFEKGRAVMEIIQPRELGFYPGISRGTVYPGFVYNSESGAKSVSVKLEPGLIDARLPSEIKMYYNGGGYFVHPEKYDNVTVLCRYKDPSEQCTDEPEGPAAVVHCKVGNGHALLIGTHPEYDISSDELLSADEGMSATIKTIINDLILSEVHRKQLLRALFARIGLRVVPVENNVVQENVVPDVTPLYLVGLTKGWVQRPVSQLLRMSDVTTRIFEDTEDVFYVSALGDAPSTQAELLKLCRTRENKSPLVEIVYPSTIDAEEPVCPPKSMTPYFDIKAYFDQLVQKRSMEWGGGGWLRFGSGMLYAQVIGSTQSVLDKNFKFSQVLPSGLVCLATNQVAGRGRGRNSWVSQAGALQFSLIVRHNVNMRHAPVVFIQYIIALAVVESIRERPGYENTPLRLKWPNDIYAETKLDGLKKVGGLLINSTFVDDEFVLVIGCGINLSNPEPTVSINDLIQECNPLQARLSPEDVLAGIMVKFEVYYNQFCDKGMGPWFLSKYYERWLHSDSIVTLTTHNNESVKIVGITSDYGMLKVESLDRRDKFYGLLPDGNSFDMMKGLLVQKK